jgi:purine nucleoside permease
MKQLNRRRARTRGASLLCALIGIAAVPRSDAAAEPLAIKVLIVNMFSLEAAPWVHALHELREIRVPGLPADHPAVSCDPRAVCQMTTGMGHANAAASMMAVLYSGLFDLRQTYVIVAGIAGIDPLRGTIGSVAWARYVVDMGIAQEIDAREMPRDWRDGYFGVMTDGPGKMPGFEYQTEMFRLDEDLLQRALALSRTAALEDRDDVRSYRAHYPSAPANAPPQVVQCDTLTDDTWWAGDRLGKHARDWTLLLTRGAGVYCTTQQEDNATLNVLTRGAHSGLVDLRRVAVMRSGVDFDRPYPHQGAFEGVKAQRSLMGAVRISTDNLTLAGMPLVDAIVSGWDQWQHGVPPPSP